MEHSQKFNNIHIITDFPKYMLLFISIFLLYREGKNFNIIWDLVPSKLENIY